MNQDEKKKFKPVNPEIVMLKVQQALIDIPDAKWIEISGFRKCRTTTNVVFERGIPALTEPYTYDPKKTEELFKNWVITKLYIPADSLIEVNDLAKNRNNGLIYLAGLSPHLDSICSAKLAKETFVDVMVRGVADRELVVKTKNHILANLHSMYKMFNLGDKDFRVGLTNKNWKVLKNDVKFDGMVKLVNGVAKTKYVYSSAWKSHAIAVVDKFNSDVKDLLEVHAEKK